MSALLRLSLLASIVSLTACGGGGGDDPAPSGNGPAAAPAPSPAPSPAPAPAPAPAPPQTADIAGCGIGITAAGKVVAAAYDMQLVAEYTRPSASANGLVYKGLANDGETRVLKQVPAVPFNGNVANTLYVARGSSVTTETYTDVAATGDVDGRSTLNKNGSYLHSTKAGVFLVKRDGSSAQLPVEVKNVNDPALGDDDRVYYYAVAATSAGDFSLQYKAWRAGTATSIGAAYSLKSGVWSNGVASPCGELAVGVPNAAKTGVQFKVLRADGSAPIDGSLADIALPAPYQFPNAFTEAGRVTFTYSSAGNPAFVTRLWDTKANTFSTLPGAGFGAVGGNIGRTTIGVPGAPSNGGLFVQPVAGTTPQCLIADGTRTLDLLPLVNAGQPAPYLGCTVEGMSDRGHVTVGVSRAGAALGDVVTAYYTFTPR